MNPARPIALALGLLAMTPALGASAPQPATPEEVARLIREITTTRDVAVRHLVSRVERVKFFTRRPCARLRVVAEFAAEPGAEWVDSLVSTLELAHLDSLATLPLRSCWIDTTRQDHLRITFGKGERTTDAYPNFSDLECAWVSGSIYLRTPLEPHVAGLRALLHRALPRDSLLDDMPSCIPPPDSLVDLDEPPVLGATAVPPDELPQAVHRGAPLYPEIARRAQVEGTVTIAALVSREGLVTRTVIAKSIPELDEEAVRAVEQWTFQPARSRGKPVAVWINVPVDFRLH